MKYHLIGDQGISMQGIRQYLENAGHTVTGSDLKSKVHKKENINSDIDMVIRSSAISPGSEGWCEVEEAERLGITVLKRSEFLGRLTNSKRLIAISGMHGKTTITTLAGLLLIRAGFDPTVLVGEKVPEFNDSVLRIGKSEWFVMEACEYDRSFLDFHPEILILTNIEEEHLDTYPGGIDEIMEAFQKYIRNVKPGGTIIACSDDPNVKVLLEKKNNLNVIFYGKSSGKYNAVNFPVSIPGEHNRQNLMAILALADYLNVPTQMVCEIALEYKGAKRRFEIKGQYNGATIVDDYGHHPTEIKATLLAAKEKYPDKKIIAVFWPHQYKRILPLLKQFGLAFTEADEVIVKPIFYVPGRDQVMNVKSKDIVDLIKKENIKAQVMETDEEIERYLKGILDKNSVLLTIGIPPVYKIADKLTGI